MRIRTIKPEFWLNEDIAEFPESTRLLAIGLLNYADDDGYFKANASLIKAAIFPLHEPSSSIPVMLQELSSVDYIRLGIGKDGKEYGRVTKFCEHQVISHPKASKIKPLCELLERSSNVPVSIQYPSDPELNRIELKGTKPPISPKGDDALFEKFWQAYPKRVGKGAALKAWSKIKPKPNADLVEKMLMAIQDQKQSDQWNKDYGQYIPNPATWLNQSRWLDEVDEISDPEAFRPMTAAQLDAQYAHPDEDLEL